MSAKQLSQLPQLFRSPFLRKVAFGRYYRELVERLEVAGLTDLLGLKLSDIFDSVYEILLKNYRCEYVFKNSLTQHWFKSRRASQQSYVTDEFRVGECRVDLAIFSATSVAFEIKTEFDSASRLPSQSREFIKVFDLVYVVTTESMLGKLQEWIPDNVGLMILDASGRLRTLRDSKCHANQTDLVAIFNCLRQAERVAVVEKVSGRKVNAPNAQRYTECKRMFRSLLPFEAQNHALEQLRNRSYPTASVALMSEVPNSLQHAALTLRATNQEMHKIRDELRMIPHNKEHKSNRHDEHILPIPAR